jgi:phosphate transport system substrate-binding protein
MRRISVQNVTTRTRLGAFAAVGAIALTAVACGGSSSSSSSSDSGSTSSAAASGSASGSSSSGTLTGSGSTFQLPIVQKWAGDFAAADGIKVNYQGVGSGAGILAFTGKTVNFGGTDAPMKDEEIAAAAKAGGDVLHIPIVLGSEPIIYNLPDVAKLQLDGPTLANIYLGKITKWSDPAIAALNTGAKLPDTAITVVHRSDSSGTSFVFTGYLSAVSADWKSQVGQDKEPQWPVGEGAEKNDGVAAQVKGTVGAIGFVELAYALQNKIPFAALKNKAGEYVLPSLASTTAAGAGGQYPADLRFSLLDSATKGAYPIVTATWQLVWKDPSKAGLSSTTAANLKKFLLWELSDGQKTAASLNFAPLPSDLDKLATASVDTIAG